MLNKDIEIIAKFMGWEYDETTNKTGDKNGYWYLRESDNNGFVSVLHGALSGAYQLGEMEYSTSWDWAMEVYVKLRKWKIEFLRTRNGMKVLPTVSKYWGDVETHLLYGEDIENFAVAIVKMVSCYMELAESNDTEK